MSLPWLFSHALSSLSTSSSSPTYPTRHRAENRAPQLPQVMIPENLRLSQGSKLILEIHINFLMYRKRLEKKITELSPKMHFDVSVERIADSDLGGGELQKRKLR